MMISKVNDQSLRRKEMNTSPRSLQEKQELLDCYESDNELLDREGLLFKYKERDLLLKYKEGYVFIEQEESRARIVLELLQLKSKAFRCNDALAKKPRRTM